MQAATLGNFTNLYWSPASRRRGGQDPGDRRFGGGPWLDGRVRLGAHAAIGYGERWLDSQDQVPM